MPEWNDTALILSTRPYGEDAVLLGVLTAEHGRQAGIVRGGQSRRGGMRGTLQPGNCVTIRWRARLEEHLGTMTAEMMTPYAAQLLDNPLRLAALTSLAAILEAALVEREPHAPVYDATLALVMILAEGDDDTAWIEAYIRWEIAMLGVAGYALQLDRCAVSGVREGLGFVSPKTGAAVTVATAGVHKPRLLRLPCFLGGVVGQGAISAGDDLLDGMELTRYFLAEKVFAVQHKPIPKARESFGEMLRGKFHG